MPAKHLLTNKKKIEQHHKTIVYKGKKPNNDQCVIKNAALTKSSIQNKNKTSKPYTKKDNVAHTETHKPARQAES